MTICTFSFLWFKHDILVKTDRDRRLFYLFFIENRTWKLEGFTCFLIALTFYFIFRGNQTQTRILRFLYNFANVMLVFFKKFVKTFPGLFLCFCVIQARGGAKGQLISECLFDNLKFSKKTQQKFDKFLP